MGGNVFTSGVTVANQERVPMPVRYVPGCSCGWRHSDGAVESKEKALELATTPHKRGPNSIFLNMCRPVAIPTEQ
jgi:hypothetical protein